MKPLTLAILSALSAGAHAAETAPSDTPAPAAAPLATTPEYLKPTTLDTLKVVGQRLFPYQEGMVLNERYIQDQAKGNGDIGTLLRINPNVQFDDSAAMSSNRMGEIRPTDFSINGAQYYQNLLQLDGASFNNDIDPQSSNPHVVAEVPSVAQGIALDTDLIGSLTVFDSNVPANFGGFNGGVVDARSRQAGDRFGGKLNFRMSRSTWNEMIIDPGDRQDFLESAQYSNQPVYDKYKVGLMLEGRLDNGLGLIGTFTRTRSDIPLRGYTDNRTSPNDAFIKEQRRENTSASLRGDIDLGGVRLWASVTHAPTDERYFTINTKNSWFDIKQGGPVASVRAAFDVGAWTVGNTLSYSDVESSRRGQSGVEYWKTWARSEAYDWGVNNNSQEGNWGNVDQTSRDIGYKLVADRAPFRWGDAEHRIQAGVEYADRRATYHRLNDHDSYLSPGTTTSCLGPGGVEDSVSCSLSPVFTSVTNGVVAGRGQFFRTRNIYSAGYFEVAMAQWALFVQDDIRLGRWSIRPGLRLDGDDLMDQKTLAPRLALSWDVFGNQSSLLTAGANRYYGRSLFSYKLREGRENLQTAYARSSAAQPWRVSRRYTAANRFEALDIPYSDELMTGWNQRWSNLDINVKYVRREGRDEVLRREVPSEDGSGYYASDVYEYFNGGRSSSDIYTLAVGLVRPWEAFGAHTQIQLATDKTETKRNYGDYMTDVTATSYNQWVRYNGALIRRHDLPPSSYNRPWTARLSTQTRWEKPGLLWSNFLRYRAGNRTTTTVGTEVHEGRSIDVIEDIDLPATWTWDSTVEYTVALPRDREVYARVEAMNVLNRSNAYRTGTAVYYEPGRSYWLELGYRF